MDTQAPVFSSFPVNTTVECNAVPPAAPPPVSDNCDASVNVVLSESSTQTNNGSCTDFNYSITRTWIASDHCGNTASVTQIITVLDTQPPVILNPPANVLAVCGAVPAPANVSATDHCDPTPVVVFTENSTQTNNGTCSDQNYFITRTWTAADQ